MGKLLKIIIYVWERKRECHAILQQVISTMQVRVQNCEWSEGEELVNMILGNAISAVQKHDYFKSATGKKNSQSTCSAWKNNTEGPQDLRMFKRSRKGHWTKALGRHYALWVVRRRFWRAHLLQVEMCVSNET